MVDDDLSGKASSDAPFGERFDQSLLDRADRGDSGVVEAGAEGYDEQFVFADPVLIEGVIQRSVAGEQVFVCTLDALREVFYDKIADGFQFSQALHDAFHFETFLFEYGFPGIFFIAGHVVIGVIAADDHERFEDDSLIAAFLSSRHDVVQGRSRFDGAHKAVLQTHLVESALHGSIDAVGSSFRTMTHENDRGLAVVIGFGFFINCACDRYEIGVGRQQVLADRDAVERIGIFRCGRYDVLIFQTVHQVGRLDDDVLDAVVDRAVHRFFEVIDDFAVSVLHVIDNDLRGEASAHVKLRKCRSNILFDRADGESSGVVEAGAERYDEDLRGADAVLVERIIQGRVAGLVVFFVFGFSRRFLRRGACCQRAHDQGHCQQQGKNFLEIHVFLLFLPRHMKQQTRRYNQFLVAQGKMPLYQGRQVS